MKSTYMDKEPEYTLKDIEVYIDEVCKKCIFTTAKEINSLEPGRMYDERVRLSLNSLFLRGRYTTITEYAIEHWLDPSFVKAATDIKLINQLTPARKTKLGFIRSVMETAIPLFKRQPFNLSLPPFNFENKDYSLKNSELTAYIYNSTYIHLAATMLQPFLEIFSPRKNKYYGMINKHISYPLSNIDRSHEGKYEEFCRNVKDAVRMLEDIDNHLELGKRMGLTERGQYLYDLMDGYVCERYYYDQVDAAKELDQWMTDNDKALTDKQNHDVPDLLYNEIKRLALKYHLSLDRTKMVNYIYLDILGFSYIPDEAVEEDDDSLDLDGLNLEDE